MSREYPCVYYDNQKCTLNPEPGYTDWCVMGPCSHETPSNADHIRSMTDEELAQKFNGGCPPIRPNDEVCMVQKSCTQCWLDWLKLPYKEVIHENRNSQN